MNELSIHSQREPVRLEKHTFRFLRLFSFDSADPLGLVEVHLQAPVVEVYAYFVYIRTPPMQSSRLVCKQTEFKRLETRPVEVQLEARAPSDIPPERGSRKTADLTVRLPLREAIYSAGTDCLYDRSGSTANEIERERSGSVTVIEMKRSRYRDAK